MQIRKPLVALAALLFLFTAHAQAADLGDLKLLPADGDIVVQVDVKALVGTALVADLLVLPALLFVFSSDDPPPPASAPQAGADA